MSSERGGGGSKTSVLKHQEGKVMTSIPTLGSIRSGHRVVDLIGVGT